MHGKISDVRGLGLIDAIELTVSAPEVSQKMLEKGILVNSIGRAYFAFGAAVSYY